MTTPKKPGTDLAALKARLAKKSKDGEEAAAPADAGGGAPPVEAVADAAGAAQQHYDPPAAFEQPAFSPEVPAAPMSMAPPMAAPSMAPPMAQPSVAPPMAPSFSPPAAAGDDPFAGPGGSFDPGPDLGGESVPGRSNVGIIAFSGAIFLAVGLGVGWLGHKIVSGNERNEKAKAKGDEMYQEVVEAGKARASLGAGLSGAAKTVMENPVAGKDAIVALLKDTFEKKPDLSRMYGWQLASLDANSIKKVFELYEKLNRVAIELAEFAGFLEANAAVLGAAGGPVTFGVKFTADGAQLVALTAALCGDPANLAALTACEDPGKAVAFKVQEALGAEPKTLLKGTAADQVVFLPPVGNVYNYAIGLEPAKHAQQIRDSAMKRIESALGEMKSAEDAALKATQGYAENPNLDGPQEL